VEEPLMSSRDSILQTVRTSLGRTAGQPAEGLPPVRIVIPEVEMEARIASVRTRVEALAGKTARAATAAEACAMVAAAVEGKTAVASNSPYLAE
jgi:hypothetical protein